MPNQDQPSESKIDKSYLKGIPGILKMIEVVFVLVAFICATISLCAGGVGVKEYFQFATMGTFIAVLFLWIILILKLHQKVFKCACVNWPFFEFMCYVVILIFLFFACLFISIFGCDSARKAGAFFGWVAFFTFFVDFVLSLRIYLASRGMRTTESPPAATAYPDTQPRY